SKYQTIFAANSDILKNPDVIHPDQELIIPNL
ncbi:MAG: nucleoid-associated protein YgaU, partial [Psychroserpens sp.]